MKSLVTGTLFGPVNYRGIIGDMPSGNVYSVRPGVPIIVNVADLTVLLDRGFTVVPPSTYVLGAKTLTSEQILNALTSPTEIVETPPPDCLIVLTNSIYIYSIGTVPYVGGGLGLIYGDLSTAADSGDNSICAITNNAGVLADGGLAGGDIDLNTIVGVNVVYSATANTPYTEGNGTLTIVALGLIVPTKIT